MRVPRWVAGLLLAAGWTVISLTSATAAKAEPYRVVVEDFEGPGGATVRAEVLRSLRGVRDVVLVPRREVDDAAVRLRVGMGSPPGFVAVARELSLHAFVHGTVEQGRGYRVTVQVRDARDGRIARESAFAGRRARQVSRAVRRGFWRRMGGAILASRVPATGALPAAMASLEDEEPPPPDLSRADVEAGRRRALDPELFPEQGAEDPDGQSLYDEIAALFDGRFRRQHVPLEAHLGLRGVNRGFRYVDDRDGVMPPYDMPLAPELALGGEWFPGAHLTNGALAHLGITGQGSQSLFLRSQGPNGASYPTSDTYWSLGLLLRLPLGPSRLTVEAGYGHHAFSIEAAHLRDGTPDIASVGYEHGRFGLGARIALGDLSLHLGGTYLLLLDAGEIAEARYFPRTTGHGLEARIGFGYPLGSGFELRGSVDGRLYLLDFHANEDDPLVVAGALDRFIGATAALAWQLAP